MLKCYKLVFSKQTINENIGSIISNIYIIGYIISFGIFLYTKASYLIKEINKLLIDENNDNILNKEGVSIFDKNEKGEKAKEKADGENNKEINEDNTERNNIDTNKDVKVIRISNMKNSGGRNNKRNSDMGALNSNSINMTKNSEKIGINKRSSYIPINKNQDLLSNNIILSSKGEMNNLDKVSIKDISKTPSEKSKDKKSNNSLVKSNEKLSDYELNELEYKKAIELDNRNFFRIYWYYLKREHIILYTFFNWNDFNLFSVKLSKLFFLISSDMAFNVFFFSDESMHKIYESGGDSNFVGQFAQMIYSTIISQLLQVFINFLTMTDINYYQLKELKRDNNINGKKGISIIRRIKIKLIAYFCSSFLLFLFFWYTASAFCSVYTNTQGIFIGDSYMSFLMGLIYPFALYLIPAGLRIISLKFGKKQNLRILYSLSDKIPIF